MPTYLVINHSSVECKTSAPKPYAVVNSTGYVPLTTDTHSSNSLTLRGNDGVVYEVVEHQTSTTEETITINTTMYSGTSNTTAIFDNETESQLKEQHLSLKEQVFTYQQYSSSGRLYSSSYTFYLYLTAPDNIVSGNAEVIYSNTTYYDPDANYGQAQFVTNSSLNTDWENFNVSDAVQYNSITQVTSRTYSSSTKSTTQRIMGNNRLTNRSSYISWYSKTIDISQTYSSDTVSTVYSSASDSVYSESVASTTTSTSQATITID